MISSSSHSFLKQLLDTPGPSGFESAAAALWRAEASQFATVTRDVSGNSFAVVNPNGSPTIMLAGHIDEIGIIVTYIDDNGFVYISPIGGWDPQVLVAQRIRFIGRQGDVFGVIGKLPIHLIKPADREKAARLEDLWVDIGVKSRAEAESLLSVGDAGVIDSRVLELPNNTIASRSIDNRIGAFVVLDALRRYAEQPGAAKVVAVATCQEEISHLGGGALTSAAGLKPAMAIAVDVTFASDHPSIEKKIVGDIKIGGGPVITRGAALSPVVTTLLRNTAESNGMTFALHASGRDTSTDADAIALSRDGVATGLVSVPNRYMHSPNELVSLDDVDHTAELLALTCRAVTKETDFTAR
jgi:endoglucanase